MRHPASLILSIFLMATGIAYSQSDRAADNAPSTYQVVSGLDWMEMSAGERMDQVMAAMLLLNKNGISLSYRPDHYYDVVYKKIQRNPSLYGTNVTSILADEVYDKEPQARPALDRVRRK